ncbi:MAG TPA: alpha-glucuronidase family glycosyl hydrolase [Acidimicrobiales bacterium]|nr:alpha-glucuronidase family glycosyl hydrolase [Acidimicrobiales bacterium]
MAGLEIDSAGAAKPPNETGYECWLRYRLAASPQVRRSYAAVCQRVVARGATQVQLSVRKELAQGLGAIIGRAPEFLVEPPGEGGYLATGTTADQWLLDVLARAGVPAPLGDGFVLLGQVLGPAGFIIGGSDTGCLYGAFAFLRRLQLGEGLPEGPVVEQPAMALRMLDHWDNLDGTVERGYAGKSIFFAQGNVVVDRQRLLDYGRLLASVGVNAVALNNVNVAPDAMALLTKRHLGPLSALAGILRRFGVRVFLSVAFEAPIVSGGLLTADPKNALVSDWWSRLAETVYGYIPDLGGFLVKAGSESRAGPHSYGRTHADAANAVAAGLEPYGGSVLWRTFVYDCQQDWRDRSTDRAKAAHDEFVPLEGHFAHNVVLQVKAGPVDFQVREPPSPLLGAMANTAQVLEVQLSQEYTGQQVHLFYLVPAWKEVLGFDTHATGPGATVAKIVCGASSKSGMAGVANVGDDPNWTGHHLAQANLYGFGRLAWCPDLAAEQVASEWARLTFGDHPASAEVVTKMLMASGPAYESYTTPLGLGWMVTPGAHYGPSPDGYEYDRWGTYHFADSAGIGVDRTASHGTGFTAQYRQPWQDIFDDPSTCPEDLLLFFHHLRYDFLLPSGTTLLQRMYDLHFEGAEMAEHLLARWRSLAGLVDAVRYRAVEERLALQLRHAREWRDVVNTYLYRKSGKSDDKGRRVY